MRWTRARLLLLWRWTSWRSGEPLSETDRRALKRGLGDMRRAMTDMCAAIDEIEEGVNEVPREETKA